MPRRGWMTLGLLLLTRPAWAQGVVRVIHTQGAPQVLERGKPRPLRSLEKLVPGTELELPSGSAVVAVSLATGLEHRLQGPGRGAIHSGPQPQGSWSAITSQPVLRLPGGVKVPREDVGEAGIRVMGKRAMWLAPGPELAEDERSLLACGLKLVSPQGWAVRSPRPTFTWEAAGGLVSQTFTLEDEAGRPVVPPMVLPTEARSLASPVALKAGRIYRWRVECQLPGGGRARVQQRLTRLPALVLARLDSLRPSPEAQPLLRSRYACLLERLGLQEEAEAAFRAMEAAP